MGYLSSGSKSEFGGGDKKRDLCGCFCSLYLDYIFEPFLKSTIAWDLDDIFWTANKIKTTAKSTCIMK